MTITLHVVRDNPPSLGVKTPHADVQCIVIVHHAKLRALRMGDILSRAFFQKLTSRFCLAPRVVVEVAVDGGAFFDSHRLDDGAASEGALAAGGDQGVLNRNSRLAKRTESGQQRRPLGQRPVRDVFQVVSDKAKVSQI